MFYPIELDRLTNQLEKTEKKIKDADHGIYVAKDEIQNLNRNIADKEIQLKINEQNFGPKSAELTKESAKYEFTFLLGGGGTSYILYLPPPSLLNGVLSGHFLRIKMQH